MGILDFVKKKNKSSNVKRKSILENASYRNQNDVVTFSVYERLKPKESSDVVVGRLNGKLKLSDAIYVTNPGDDDTPTVLTVVAGLEKLKNDGEYEQLTEAEDILVRVKLENISNINIKPGTVLYSKDASVEEVHDAYITAIGDVYIQQKNIELTDEELNRASITDLAEVWRLFNGVMSKMSGMSQDEYDANYKKIGRIVQAMVKKLWELDYIYVVYNKKTNEPNLYSRTIKRDQGYECTPPDIMVVTEAYHSVFSQAYQGSDLELRKIENGEDKKGIYNVLGNAFYLNGAQGVDFMFMETAVSYEQFIPQPNYSGMREVDIPVTNPDLKRWRLLLEQLGNPKNENQELISNLYYRFMGKALVNARFLIPMKFPNGKPESDENVGEIILKKDTTINLPVMPGMNGREAIHMYTDWKKLREKYDDNWEGWIMPAEEIIDVYDFAINVSDVSNDGFYVSKDMFEEMKEMK